MGRILVSSIIPTADSKRLIDISVVSEFSGNVPGFPITEPIKESLLVNEGSRLVPIAIRPPGLTDSTLPAEVPKEIIWVCMGSYTFFFSLTNLVQMLKISWAVSLEEV